jgi:hypothetical protein
VSAVPSNVNAAAGTAIPSSLGSVGKPSSSYANTSISSTAPTSAIISPVSSINSNGTSATPTDTTEDPLLSPVATPQATPFAQPYFACANGGQGVPEGGANQACTFAIFGSLNQDKTRASCFGQNSALIKQGGACFGQEFYLETCSCLQDDFNLRDEIISSRKAAAAAAATPASSSSSETPAPTPTPAPSPTPAPAAPATPAKKVGKGRIPFDCAASSGVNVNCAIWMRTSLEKDPAKKNCYAFEANPVTAQCKYDSAEKKAAACTCLTNWINSP